MINKKKVLQTTESLPQEFSLDDLVERLIVLEKIEKRLEQVSEGKTVSTEEARKKLKKWLK